jgi:hypothetical protein
MQLIAFCERSFPCNPVNKKNQNLRVNGAVEKVHLRQLDVGPELPELEPVEEDERQGAESDNKRKNAHHETACAKNGLKFYV